MAESDDHRAPSSPTEGHTWGRLSLLAAAVFFAAGLALMVDPINMGQSIVNRAWIAAFAAVMVLALVWRCRGTSYDPVSSVEISSTKLSIGSTRWLQSLLLTLACVFAVFNYYRFDSKAISTVEDHYDITYYYLNSKYFDELGYSDLYAAMLVADEDHRHRLNHITRFRDLHTYKNVRRKDALPPQRDRIRANFSDARWLSFKEESDFLIATTGKSALNYFFKDHGYNPPPTWTLVGSFFSKNVSIDHLKWITMVDFVLVFLMFVVILRTYGLETMLFALLFMSCTASGKWPVVGQALLRFDWLVAVVIASCMLKRKQHGLAGGLLAYASLSRIFPAIFFFTYAVTIGWDLVKRRGLTQPARRFVLGAAVVSTLMIGGAIANTGVQSFIDSKDTLALHNSAESYSSLRVGLGDALIYRGERNWQHLKEHGGIPGRADELGDLKIPLHAVGLGILCLIGVYVVRRSPTAAQALPLAYFAFFALTTPQINYHNIRLLLVLWHLRSPHRSRDAFGLICLFTIEVIAHFATLNGSIPYAVTSLTSVGLTLYGIGILGTILIETTRKSTSRPHKSPPMMIAIVTVMLLISTVSIYWRAGTVPSPAQTLAIDEINSPRRPGERWTPKSAVIPDYTGIRIELPEVSHAPRVEISFDHDDRYRIEFYRGDRRVHEQGLRNSDRRPRGHLTQRRIRLPAKICDLGYDAIHVLPSRGDPNFAIGHLRLLP